MNIKSIKACLYSGLVFVGTVFHVLAADEPILKIELNRLETIDGACVAYFVFRNSTARLYTEMQLDLVPFDKNELVLQRIALNPAPITAKKTTVKLFELSRSSCANLGRVLVNEVVRCETYNGVVPDCIDQLEFSSRTAVDLFR